LPTWGDIVTEVNHSDNAQPNGSPNYDKVRRKYLVALSALTERPAIVYSSGFLDSDYPADDIAIALGDVQGFMNAVADLPKGPLDLLITSPGGSPEATESIIGYLRTHFDHLRAFVPVAAMSAATMLALGCDEIVMGAHSQLGPIDPQFTIFTPDGPRSAPGQAIIGQFEQAKSELRADPQAIGAWMPILRGLLPGLLAMCRDQQEVSQRMVRKWLEEYMLHDDPDRTPKAAAAATWFADYQYFGSHSRRVSLQDVQALGLRATALEDDQTLQDAVLSVHHCYSITHSHTGAAKIIENNLGRAYVKLVRQVLVPARPAQSPGGPVGFPPVGPPNRAQRRRQDRGRR